MDSFVLVLRSVLLSCSHQLRGVVHEVLRGARDLFVLMVPRSQSPVVIRFVWVDCEGRRLDRGTGYNHWLSGGPFRSSASHREIEKCHLANEITCHKFLNKQLL